MSKELVASCRSLLVERFCTKYSPSESGASIVTKSI